MANYFDIGIADAPFVAGEDLTQKQWHFVTVGSVYGEVKAANGASNPAPLGILQNSPSVGMEATVRIYGFSKLVCDGASLNPGKWLFCASDGQGEGVATQGGSAISARYLDQAATGSLIARVHLFGFTACAFGAAS